MFKKQQKINKDNEINLLEKDSTIEKYNRNKTEDSTPKKTTKKKNKKHKVTTTEYIAEKMLSKVTRGQLDNQSHDLEFGSQMIMSLGHCKRVIQITEFPEFVRAGHLEQIITQIKRSPISVNTKDLNISILEHNLPFKIFMADKRIKGAERGLISYKNNLENEIMQSTVAVSTGKNIRSSRDSIKMQYKIKERLSRKLYSFKYINREINNRGGSLVKTFIFIEITSKDKTALTDITRDLVQSLNSNNYKAIEITDLENYTKEFSLISLKPSFKPITRVIPMTSTTKLSSLSSDYVQGLVRSRLSDIYIGHEVTQGYPAFISYSEVADKYVEIILADSRSGKTTMSSTRSLYAVCHKGGTYKQVARDYKGDEGFTRIANLLANGREISMKLTNPTFINPFPIPKNPEKFGIKRKDMVKLCKVYSAKMVATLAGAGDPSYPPDKRDMIENMASDIIAKAYHYTGLRDDDSTTFDNPAEYNFQSIVWKAVVDSFAYSDQKDKYYGDTSLISLVRDSLQPYFSEQGSKNYMLRNQIDIEEAMLSDYVTFNYGLKLGATGTILTSREKAFRTLQETFFVRLYAASNFLKGHSTLYWIDDLQEQLDDMMSLKELKEIITIGGSLNMKPILITNEITKILTDTNATLASMKENISICTIGRCKEEQAFALLKYLGYNTVFNRSRDVFANSGNMRFSYVNVANSGGDLVARKVKVLLPKHLLEGPIFTNMTVER